MGLGGRVHNIYNNKGKKQTKGALFVLLSLPHPQFNHTAGNLRYIEITFLSKQGEN